MATQAFSRSVGDALRLCKDHMKIDIFSKCQPTINSLNNFNDLFDVFNSRNLNAHGFKNTLSSWNAKEVFEFLGSMHSYIVNMKLEDGTYVVKSKRKTGYVVFLISINGLKE